VSRGPSANLAKQVAL